MSQITNYNLSYAYFVILPHSYSTVGKKQFFSTVFIAAARGAEFRAFSWRSSLYPFCRSSLCVRDSESGARVSN